MEKKKSENGILGVYSGEKKLQEPIPA